MLLAFGTMAVVGVGWALWMLSHPATTILYRAMSDAERRDILAVGRFRCVGHSTEGKWLAEQHGHARAWGRQFYPKESFCIAAVTLRTAVADALFRSHPNLDQIGSARYAELEQLESAMIEVIEEVRPS